jgi:tetratricopeptide (TPR) repeat protein
METGETETLIERLVANPHDTDALSRAHHHGEADPQGYASLLEQVGTRTEDPSYASHWLSEAANVWSVTLGDAHRAARVLMLAVDRDPTQPLAADRLAQLYRDKGDVKALVAMIERRVRLLTPMLTSQPETTATLRPLLATLHEELGRLWSEPPLDQPRKAIEHYRRSIEFDPAGAFAIFSIRELYKSFQMWDEAIPTYAMELAVEQDTERRVMLLRDEAATRRLVGDMAGVSRALRAALDELRSQGGDDPALAQELAGSLLDRADAHAPLDDAERAYGADLLAGLAESFDGEHGLAYAAGALDLVHGHDRAMQLFAFYSAAAGAGQSDVLSLRYHAYVEANPTGPLALEARLHLAARYEALGQIPQAFQVLAPLRGQPEIDRRISTLQSHAQAQATPIPPAGGEQAEILTSPAVQPVLDTEEVEAARHPSAQMVKDAAMESAHDCLAKSDKTGALEAYLEVLKADPIEPEALSWVEDTLRAKRDYGKLRDVLWASARAATSQDSLESRKLRLQEIAGLSESNLKDIDGAIQAWRQVLALDRGDDSARQALIRALEKAQRWDDLANVYEQEASAFADVDGRIQLEKKLAALHDQKRGDPLAAAEAWARIADLTPEEDDAITISADFFEKASRRDLAIAVIQERAQGVTDGKARAALFERLGGLLLGGEGTRDVAAAGRAYQRAAEAEPSLERWTAAERAFAEVQDWAMAATAAERAAEVVSTDGPQAHAEALARAAKYLRDAGDSTAATARLEQAHSLAPDVDRYAVVLIEDYRASADVEKLVHLLRARGHEHPDKTARVAALREAARLFEAAPLENEETARAEWLKLLEVDEDVEALQHLIDISIRRGEFTEAAGLLARLGSLATTKDEKVAIAMREADLLSRGPEGTEAAVQRYEWILENLDSTSRPALRAIAGLEERRGAPAAAAKALERELTLANDDQARRDIANLLVRSYDAAGDDEGMATALEAVRKADPEDFEALQRLATLTEKLGRWDKLVSLLSELIEVEADEAEVSVLTRKRASILVDKLGRGDDALAALQDLADAGELAAREDYVALGDRLGWRGIVATKLVDWSFREPHSDARTQALMGAFDRFVLVGRDADAVRVGIEILRTSRDAALAQRLEELAAKTSDETGLTAAQEILGLELNGAPRAAELVRQAEMRVRTGMAWAESVQHGETALGGLSLDDAEPLLARLAALIPTPDGVIDLYERQISRSRGGDAREKALIRAAQVAGERGDLRRARIFFDLAVTGTPTDVTLDAIAESVRHGSQRDGLCRTLAEAMAQAGEGVRDGGRCRANLLRRAALVAQHDLHDIDQAFAWLSDALVAHADASSIDALVALGEEAGSARRIDDVLTHALTEVFDGPLVRLLLARRAKLRKEILDDRIGAAADLKKLHDLSPADEAVVAELSALLTEQGDHRAMVQLYEDQILRSKDQAVRADLGRKVAQLWESELQDPREAADAWRRVLRLRPGDEEATQGLDRAKTNMLHKKQAPAVAAPAPASSRAEPTPQAAEPAPVATATVERVTPTPGDVEEVPTDPPSAPEEALPAAETAAEDGPGDDEPGEQRTTDATPESDNPMASADLFREADTTATSIDVRLARDAARHLGDEDLHPASAPPPPAAGRAAVPSRRASKPPPLPAALDGGEQVADAAERAGTARSTTTDPAPATSAESTPSYAPDEAADAPMTPHDLVLPATPPADILSASELMTIDDDDEDVLVVDELVESIDDEFEDVAEPSKPPHGQPSQ